jgi:L-lactate dehydrogenase complex protein LldG
MATADATARENILSKITRANARLSPAIEKPSLQQVFAPIENPRQRFLEECAANLTEVIQTRDHAGSAEALHKVLSTLPGGEVYVQDDPSLSGLTEKLKQWRVVKLSSQAAPAENIQASLTLAHAFVAQTGSVLMSSACGGRGASIVPPCHIVFGTGGQIVADIAAALARMESEIPNASYLGLITGSSRTADIEKILVQGAHGPRRLVVILQG